MRKYLTISQEIQRYKKHLIFKSIKIKLKKNTMNDKKPLFKPPYDIRDVSLLFGIVALFLIITAIVGNNLFGIFQENVNFG